MKIEGKTFVVTGGCGALGGASAREILERGGNVAIWDVVPDAIGNDKVKSFSSEGKAKYYKVNISERASVEAAIQSVLADFPKGSLAGAVHAAAGNKSRPWSNKLMDSVDDFREVLLINTYGTFLIDAAVSDAINSQYSDDGLFPKRVQEERGVIVNFASAVATQPPARCVTYGPSKTGVLGVTTAVSDFLGPSGIRVNTVSPSIVASKMLGDRIHYFNDELLAGAIFPHAPAEPSTIAHGVIFLIENSFVNNFDLKIDGCWRTTSNWGSSKDPRENAPCLE